MPSQGKMYILVCTDYATKWAEEKTLARATEQAIVNFLFEDIFTRFGVLREIVTDQGAQFTSKLVRGIVEKYKIKHCKYSPYHPQANGHVESTNKILDAIMTKVVKQHRRDWSDKLLEALWAYHTTWKKLQVLVPTKWCMVSKFSFPLSFKFLHID